MSILQSIKNIIHLSRFRKIVALMAAMTVVLVLGFLIFGGERYESIKIVEQALTGIEAKVVSAESFLVLEDSEKANNLFGQAWQDILPLTKPGVPLKQEVNGLKNTIEHSLAELNNLERIEDPNLIFEFDTQEIKLLPEQMILAGNFLYFFNPLAKVLYKWNFEQGIGVPLSFSDEYSLASGMENSLIFFKKPNIIAVLWQDEISSHGLSSSGQDMNIDLMALFDVGASSYLYLLDSSSGEITKHSVKGQGSLMEIGLGQAWLKNPGAEARYLVGAQSLAIDGSLWLISNNGEIVRFYAGKHEDTIKPSVFPFLEKPTKILTSPTNLNLYVLEPSKNRVLVLNKGGGIIKQFQSKEFDNLLDLAISPDEKTLFLLNGLKVYQIQL